MKKNIPLTIAILTCVSLFSFDNKTFGFGVSYSPFPLQIYPGETATVLYVLQAADIEGDGGFITLRHTIMSDSANIASLPGGEEYIDYVVTTGVNVGAISPVVITIPIDLPLGTYDVMPRWQHINTDPSGGTVGFSVSIAVHLPVEVIPGPATVPPVVSAGDNIEILSTEQSYTVIEGTAADQDGDTLQYRWLEGEQVLLDWSPVGENGEAYLNLGTLPYLSVGNHTLTLEVREVKVVNGVTS
jgi:hypothetical protein